MAGASAPARAGLVGHPSDGYGGATLAVALANFSATVVAEPAGALEIVPAGAGQWPAGGRPLIAAAVRRFAAARPHFDARVRVRFGTTIPRRLGLGGSSALVIAALRSLAALDGAAIPDRDLPELALAVEAEELGIAAGLQDRVVQTLGGLVFMDFASGAREPLDPRALPDLFVAWRPGAGTDSGAAHAAVRARFAAGERRVADAMAELARLAREARAALAAGDRAAFAAALDAGHDVRASIFDLDARHTAMIERARALGLPATYTGSGGAIVGVAADPERIERLATRLGAIGARLAPARVAAGGR